VHYTQSLAIRPNWEKAEIGLEQAQTALEASRQQAAGAAPGAAAADKEKAPEPVVAAPSTLDPERTVDPNIHGAILNTLHRATVESENHGRSFLQVLEKEIEPAIKELSSCLLYPDKSVGELDECVQKFEAAMHSIRSAQRSLQSSMEQVRSIGEKLIKS
jgi:exonuclease VII small subunit